MDFYKEVLEVHALLTLNQSVVIILGRHKVLDLTIG